MSRVVPGLAKAKRLLAKCEASVARFEASGVEVPRFEAFYLEVLRLRLAAAMAKAEAESV